MGVYSYINTSVSDGRVLHDTREDFIGLTLEDCEQNLYHDSYFYAVVWDVEAGKPASREYGTTAGYSPTRCNVDALPEVVAAHRAYQNFARCQATVARLREKRALPHNGATVRVTRGRKVPKGLTGVVFGSPCVKRVSYHNEVEYVWVNVGDAAHRINTANLEVVEGCPTLSRLILDALDACEAAELAAQEAAATVRKLFAERVTSKTYHRKGN